MNVEMLACIARLNLCNDVIVIRGGIFEEPTYMPIISRIIETVNVHERTCLVIFKRS